MPSLLTMRYAIDPTKIHNELGWLPETKFEDGINFDTPAAQEEV